jgi:hypothetical protein
MADGVFEQLRGEGETGLRVNRVSSHDLTAMVRELFRGEVSGPEVIAALGLLPQSVADLTVVAAELTAGNLTESEVSDIFDLVQTRTHYVNKAQTATRLGL